jgi:Flp pilus assembly protein TadD
VLPARGQPESPPPASAAGRPAPAPKPLADADAKRVEVLEKTIDQLRRAGKFTEAIEPARQVLAICETGLGPNHWQTADAQRVIDDLTRIAALPEEGRQAMASVRDLDQKMAAEHQRAHYAEAERIDRTLLEICRKWLGEGHPDTAQCYNNLAVHLDLQGRHAEAEPLLRTALAVRLKALGGDHPLTASTYNNLAANLDDQVRYAEAEPLVRKALAIRLQALGEDHPDTAIGYSQLAFNLDLQGKYAEAEPLCRQALAVRLKALGEGHPDTAQCYNNLAHSLHSQGKYAEAEPLYRQALAVRLKALGADHPDIAQSYGNLASNLAAQGSYAEAEPLCRQALAVRLKALGEGHPDTAIGYNNLAFNLDLQGKYAEAEPLCRQALAVRLKALGEGHPDTARSYNNLAFNLDRQGKYGEVEPLFRQALAIWLKALGEDHPDTALSYNNLASVLERQGKYAEAEPLLRKALAIWLKVLGEDHPDIASRYNNLAVNLDAQGKLDDAVDNWAKAAAFYERTRGARGASGLERSLTAESSPLPALATALARQGKPREAWAYWEADLARGLLDDLSARLLRPLTSDEHCREADLAGQLQRLTEQITRLATSAKRSQATDDQLETLRREQNKLRGQWVELQNALDRKYQAYAGKPSTREDIQKAVPADAALVGWLDVKRQHWACVVRHQGDPTWVKIPGMGNDGAWIKEDEERPGRLRDALAGHQPAWRTAAEALARQRLAPLMPHLKGVKHLIVLPSQALAGVPIETWVASGSHGDAPDLVVSYAPSGSMFARLTAPRSQALGPPRLLALGDPAFPKPAQREAAPSPPDHGIAILAVMPHSTADLFGIKPGDVLLEYNGKVLRTSNDLAVVPAGDKATRVPIRLWRDGEIRSLEIVAGRLGIQSSPNRPAAQVVLAQRAAADVLKPGVRGESLAPLPGTRREVQAIAALLPKDQVTTLLGKDATESNLQALAQSGALKNYRYIHLATHGKANPSVALSSAVFLAAEPERPASSSADPAALESAPDGQVTAEQIVRSWDLDADIVVLSACQTGLGHYAGGEGYLGFAQALFVKGARSLVLSLWEVNDDSTQLLMQRFYANLLGKRAGLSQPLPKAQALDEAKRWLRSLAAEEVADVARSRPRPAAAAAPARRSYDHPYFWAGFILVGDST